MVGSEMVTDFRLEDAEGKPVSLSAIVKAVNAHCQGIMDGERFCDRDAWDGVTRYLPERWRSLIAFWQEGDNEGWYVHIGCMVDYGYGERHGEYIDMGFVKLWTPDAAKKLCTEAQRFLTACRWN